MSKVRKADQPAFNEAVQTVLLRLRAEVAALAEKLPVALFTVDVPDHLFDPVRREVMNEIGSRLFAGITVPPVGPLHESDAG